MTYSDKQVYCNQELGICGPDPDTSAQHKQNKPLEIYTFIDPLCPECWAFEPILRKLQVEYGDYFRIRVFVAGKLEAWNLCQEKYKGLASKKVLAAVWEKTAARTGMSCDGDLWLEEPISSPYRAALGIKAAELQGPQAGSRFLRKLREYLFLEKQDITKDEVLIRCAENVDLDLKEFREDLYSQAAAKALQCDMRMTNEMDVDTVPTFVFFNDNVEEEGLKVTGLYPYHIYVQIMEEMLGFKPKRAEKISLEEFLARYQFVASIEVASVFDWTVEEAEKQLKKLLLQQKVELVPVKYGNFWRFLPSSC
ncbi:ClpXP adapter SpxH family protein [Halalkalibacterium ligniniphilum]|uniref:ClpXP adapter SpxH family protein n=1 Tax=Halalkalibacterium ligniniphilum TaxID=1134413 RepID=UPI00034D2ABA|nr:ClpXP adapter SpxH family protein [Halalkalibacterium ligniniphilum]